LYFFICYYHHYFIDVIKKKGDSSCYGIPQIILNGDPSHGCSISCGGDSSCEGSRIGGTNINYVGCDGDLACYGTDIAVQCINQERGGCAIVCGGDARCVKKMPTTKKYLFTKLTTNK